MKLLILCCYFPPEIGTGPHIPFEFGETLVRRGHEVTVVTGFPQYHLSATPPEYRGKLLCREEMAGMQIVRIRTPSVGGKGKISRGLGHLLMPMLLAWQALWLPKPDVVWSYTPPLAMGIAARFVARRCGVSCAVNVQDLFPQCAIDLGVLKNPLVIALFKAMELYVYRRTDVITVMSPGNRDHVISKGGRPEKVFTVPNWGDTDAIRPGERMNEFRTANGLGDEFVVTFAGTMGWSQGLETVVEAARELADEPNLVFLLVGDGVEKARLEQQAACLRNVRLLPMQPKEVYPQLLAASDACLVTLRPEVATPTVPSKINTILAAGRPILASVPLHGDAPRLINNAEAGITVPPGDPHALAAAVLFLKHNPAAAARMRSKGRRYAEENLSLSAVVGTIETILQETLHLT
jgi:glycosyltransferase involved in cell wall biosynthesis